MKLLIIYVLDIFLLLVFFSSLDEAGLSFTIFFLSWSLFGSSCIDIDSISPSILLLSFTSTLVDSASPTLAAAEASGSPSLSFSRLLRELCLSSSSRIWDRLLGKAKNVSAASSPAVGASLSSLKIDILYSGLWLCGLADLLLNICAICCWYLERKSCLLTLLVAALSSPLWYERQVVFTSHRSSHSLGQPAPWLARSMPACSK